MVMVNTTRPVVAQIDALAAELGLNKGSSLSIAREIAGDVRIVSAHDMTNEQLLALKGELEALRPKPALCLVAR
jgi:hypothetical protein